jgi:hypothetical protein
MEPEELDPRKSSRGDLGATGVIFHEGPRTEVEY